MLAFSGKSSVRRWKGDICLYWQYLCIRLLSVSPNRLIKAEKQSETEDRQKGVGTRCMEFEENGTKEYESQLCCKTGWNELGPRYHEVIGELEQR